MSNPSLDDLNIDQLKLGRKAVKTDSRTLRLAKYFTAELPAPPAYRNWSKGKRSWGMMLNDTLGDCTIAGVGHAVQVLTLNASTEATITDQQVLSYYELWDGYNPADPSTDQGGICLDVLNNWKKQKFANHELFAFASVLPANKAHVQQAINLFGGIYIGVGLPITAQAQVGKLWEVVPDNGSGDSTPGSWGGHCIFVLAYSESCLVCITWGGIQYMTWEWFAKYCDEAYALISPDWIASTGKAPNGFVLAALESDLVQIN